MYYEVYYSIWTLEFHHGIVSSSRLCDVCTKQQDNICTLKCSTNVVLGSTRYTDLFFIQLNGPDVAEASHPHASLLVVVVIVCVNL